MDSVLELLKNAHVQGVLIGLAVAVFPLYSSWKSNRTKNHYQREKIKELEKQNQQLESGLGRQLKVLGEDYKKSEACQEELRAINENLRVKNSELLLKPGRTEMRQFQIYAKAVSTMQAQAPGFSTAWENALREAEAEAEKADSGLIKRIRNILPGLPGPASVAKTEQPMIEVAPEEDD